MKMKALALVVVAIATLTISAQARAAVLAFDQNVTPDTIFGTGNTNGGFTVDQAGGVELGLRGKLRHNAVGAPENTFNSNGDGSYDFLGGVAPTQSFPTATWSFEWSINTDYATSTGVDLKDMTYELTIDTDPGPGVTLLTFDPINDVNPGTSAVQWDHSIGDNTTLNDGGSEVLNTPVNPGTIAAYDTAIDNNNVAQNSWKPHWIIPAFNPNSIGTYTISLTAFDSLSTPVASTSIDINVVPEPTTFALGALGLTLVVFGRRYRNRA